MTKEFIDAKNALLVEAHEALKRDFGSIMAEHAHKGTLYSGARWVAFHKAIAQSLERHGQDLHNLLTKYDFEHSPFERLDFDIALDGLKYYSECCERLYQERVNQGKKNGNGPVVQLAPWCINRPLTKYTAIINAEKRHFSSKTSFWRWALGDTKKKVWAAGLAILGGAMAKIPDLISWITSK